MSNKGCIHSRRRCRRLLLVFFTRSPSSSQNGSRACSGVRIFGVGLFGTSGFSLDLVSARAGGARLQGLSQFPAGIKGGGREGCRRFISCSSCSFKVET